MVSRVIHTCVVLGVSVVAVVAGSACSDNVDQSPPAGPVNRPPVLGNLSATTVQDVPVTLNLLDGASDPDHDPMTVVEAHVGGTGSVSTSFVELHSDHRTVTVTPGAGFTGTLPVQYTVEDVALNIVHGTALVTVRPEHAPSAVGGQVSVVNDTSLSLTLQGNDPDGDALTFAIVTPPQHGALSGSAPILVYAPASGFIGTDSLVFTVNDGHLTSPPATVTFNVAAVNHAPTATPQAVQATEDTPITITLAGVDPDGDTLSFQAQAPAHGTLSGSGASVIYTPAANYHGPDSFTFTVRDATLTSPPATVTIDVAPVNDPPVATALQQSLNEDTSLAITLGGTDVDGDALSFAIQDPPQHGTLSGTPPVVTYTPASNYNGPDSFTFTAFDGLATSAPATVMLSVISVDDAPVAMDGAVITAEDTPVAITLAATDIDSQNLSFFIVSPPSDGTLTGGGANWTYSPAPNANGVRSFTFRAFDGQLNSATATVTITITPVNDPPVATALQQSLNEDTSLAITLGGTDVDGDALGFAIQDPPQHGTLSGTPPAVTYTPASNYNGPDSFSFTAFDGLATSAPATVMLSVISVDDAPVAMDGAVITAEDTPVAITLAATDIDSQNLSFFIVSPPSDGTLTGDGANWTYSPAPNANGVRSFTFRAFDGQLNSATATVTITITPVQDPPVAVDDFVMTDAATPITVDVTSNDIDVDGDPLTIDSTAAPAHGSVEIVGGKLLYTPDASFTGTDVFAYTIVDPQGAAATASAHIGVGVFPPGAPAESFGLVAIGLFTINTELAPAVSSDGRFIAFTSDFGLLSDDTNSSSDVYRFDRRTHTLMLVSVSSTGVAGNFESQRPQLSADGRYVVFESFANNLVADDSNSNMDVFRHDCVTGETVRVSVATGGGQATGQSDNATVSADGNLVAFRSSAFNLIPDDANGVTDIFVRDVTAGTTTRVSLSSTGGEADRAAAEPAISGDGRFVAFSSAATNLVVGDSNGVKDVFVRDRLAGTTTRVSVSSTGDEANAACTGPAISQDGRIVSFLSDATNLVDGAQVATQLYIRDVQAQITTRPVDSEFDIIWGRLSSDGRYVTEFTQFGLSRVTIQDLIAGTGVSLPNNRDSLFWPVLSGNGRYVVVVDGLTSGGSINVQPNPL